MIWFIKQYSELRCYGMKEYYIKLCTLPAQRLSSLFPGIPTLINTDNMSVLGS